MFTLTIALIGCGVDEDPDESVEYGKDLSFVTGTVVDSWTHKPVGGVYIYLHEWDSDEVRWIPKSFTDAEGRFAFAIGFGVPIVSSYYSFERPFYDPIEVQIPLEATRITDYEYRLDVVMNRRIR